MEGKEDVDAKIVDDSVETPVCSVEQLLLSPDGRENEDETIQEQQQKQEESFVNAAEETLPASGSAIEKSDTREDGEEVEALQSQTPLEDDAVVVVVVEEEKKQEDKEEEEKGPVEEVEGIVVETNNDEKNKGGGDGVHLESSMETIVTGPEREQKLEEEKTTTTTAEAVVLLQEKGDVEDEQKKIRREEDQAAITIVKRLRAFCARHRIPIVKGNVFLITIQCNRSTEFTSLVVEGMGETDDDEKGGRCKLLPNYPIQLSNQTTSYKELSIGGYNVCYFANAPSLPSSAYNNNTSEETTTAETAAGAFCCSALQPYRHRATARDQAFRDFVAGRGNHPGIVFEVKRQRDNGPLLSTDYFTLTAAGGVERLDDGGGVYRNKLHAYKNYKCLVHGLFFAVDLYTAGDRPAINRHHMRLIPHTKLNRPILEAFFRADGV